MNSQPSQGAIVSEAKGYPYKAWILMPSFRPVEVEFTSAYVSWHGLEYDVTAKGKIVSHREIYPTKEAAIDAGWDRVLEQEAALSKRQAVLYKKREALVKAADSQ